MWILQGIGGLGAVSHRVPAWVHVVTQNAWGQALFPGTNLTVGLGLRASLGLQAPALVLCGRVVVPGRRL